MNDGEVPGVLSEACGPLCLDDRSIVYNAEVFRECADIDGTPNEKHYRLWTIEMLSTYHGLHHPLPYISEAWWVKLSSLRLVWSVEYAETALLL